MSRHPEKTERGWEIADDTGTFEDESISIVYPTKKAALSAIALETSGGGFDELRALESRYE